VSEPRTLDEWRRAIDEWRRAHPGEWRRAQAALNAVRLAQLGPLRAAASADAVAEAGDGVPSPPPRMESGLLPGSSRAELEAIRDSLPEGRRGYKSIARAAGVSVMTVRRRFAPN
jgi:hypothetical protein